MNNYLKSLLSITLCFSSFCSFSQQIADTAKDNKEALAALNGYIDALQKLDIPKAISYCSNTPDFIVFENGKAMNYEEFTTNMRTNFPQAKKVLITSINVHVRNISANAVLITGLYHETATDVNDRVFDFDVITSSVLLKKDGQWKLSYVTDVVQPTSR